ncbi:MULTISPECIES: hypothetical protein [unclassified Methanoculleus]|uniref:Uncharacterized protein n=1 Tax=Methanoculleus formosensis TaxID=2590886 RepID=A0A9E5DDJ0_9EURY|nr:MULTISPECIES: hypothetical protein [unclassified Methanoculleus]MCK9319230.1 hypothetical protein [Methanoculleus sp.]MCT8336629.1 hypothetical protein [Methanoculleus sp. Afa-1]MDD2255043.1 hypothetical protein [Methanoculleus sp.]MDD2788485.1 hypothetical protein [Methanoculleus sp.]MDD3217416.1 hypothetical protein [Methanoculleus sp.]
MHRSPVVVQQTESNYPAYSPDLAVDTWSPERSVILGHLRSGQPGVIFTGTGERATRSRSSGQTASRKTGISRAGHVSGDLYGREIAWCGRHGR